jgi:hypothetical protein
MSIDRDDSTSQAAQAAREAIRQNDEFQHAAQEQHKTDELQAPVRAITEELKKGGQPVRGPRGSR